MILTTVLNGDGDKKCAQRPKARYSISMPRKTALINNHDNVGLTSYIFLLVNGSTPCGPTAHAQTETSCLTTTLPSALCSCRIEVKVFSRNPAVI